MNNTNQFDWVNFYDALAKTLLLYRNNRDELVKKIRLTFQTININIPTVERDGLKILMNFGVYLKVLFHILLIRYKKI